MNKNQQQRPTHNTFMSGHTRGPQTTLSNTNIVKENIKPGQSNHPRVNFTTNMTKKDDTIIFTHCHFQDLSTTSQGDPIFCDEILSNIEISDCLITQCSAYFSTVGMNGPRKVSFSNCAIEYNEGGRSGGIRFSMTGNTILNRNSIIFYNNKRLGVHSDKYSQDINIESRTFSLTMDKEHVQFCWTTSLRPNCWDYSREQFTDSKLIGPVFWSIECTGWNADDVRKGVMDVTGQFWKEGAEVWKNVQSAFVDKLEDLGICVIIDSLHDSTSAVSSGISIL